jgi:hypothetical protein
MADNIEASTANPDTSPMSSGLARKLTPSVPANGTKAKKRNRQVVKNIPLADGVSLKTDVAKEISTRKVSKTCESDKENVPEDKDLGEVTMEDY